MSNEAEPNMRMIGWGLALAIVGAVLHFGYKTRTAPWMLGACLLLLAATLFTICLLTARNLRRLNRELRDEETAVALEEAGVKVQSTLNDAASQASPLANRTPA